jgi:hypothetical protein
MSSTLENTKVEDTKNATAYYPGSIKKKKGKVLPLEVQSLTDFADKLKTQLKLLKTKEATLRHSIEIMTRNAKLAERHRRSYKIEDQTMTTNRISAALHDAAAVLNNLNFTLENLVTGVTS